MGAAGARPVSGRAAASGRRPAGGVPVSWRVYLRLGRVSNLPTVWSNVLAGAVLAGARLAPGELVLLALALSLFYVGGMYLNDAFDRELDARERPERPIPAGLVRAGTVFAIGYALLAAGLLVLVARAALAGGSWTAPVAGLALALLIVYYDARHARDPLSPAVMGLCRGLVYLIAALATAGRPTWPLAAGAAALVAYVTGVTGIAAQETRAAFRGRWPLVLFVVPVASGAPALAAGIAGSLLYAAFVAWVGAALAGLRRPAPGAVPRAVVRLLAGLSLLDATLVAARGEPAAAGLAVAAFGLTLLLQRVVKGT